MRYRPFGKSGAAVSAITLSLGPETAALGPAAARQLIYSALEAGVNGYRLETADPVLAEIVGTALRPVERRLVCVSLNLGNGDGRRSLERDFSAASMTSAIDRVLHASGLGWIDVGLLDEPDEHELPQASLNALKGVRDSGRIRLLGVSGDGDVMDAYVSTGAFDVLATPYHMTSSWPVRARMREARDRDMAIFVYGYHPDSFTPVRIETAPAPTPEKRGLFGFAKGKAAPAVQSTTAPDPFAFLERTPNWTAEEICLSYSMMEPAVSSVLVKAMDDDRLNALAQVPDRDLPPGLAAQIEMARVGTAAA